MSAGRGGLLDALPDALWIARSHCLGTALPHLTAPRFAHRQATR
jgi:hypothetical protein